jgi:hypothetical protein
VKLARVAVLIATVLLTAACGASSAVVMEKAYGSPPAWEACRLVTASEASEVAGLGSRLMVNTWVPGSADTSGTVLHTCAWSYRAAGPGQGLRRAGASIELGCGTWVAATASMAGTATVTDGIKVYEGTETFLGTPPSIAISITAAAAPPGAVASALATAARTVAREGCH